MHPKTFSVTGFEWKIEDIFPWLKLFFNHPNEKKMHLTALQIWLWASFRTEEEKPSCFFYSTFFKFYMPLIKLIFLDLAKMQF